MNRFLLIAAFFTFLISTEVVVTALAVQTFGVCMTDTANDGESEKDTKEKSEDNKRIEIFSINSGETEDSYSNFQSHSEELFFTKPYLAQATPPPEA